MASVKFENVIKTFGETKVIKGVNIDIQEGELIVFVGPSGCGKSTLLRMLAGLEDVSEGNIYIGDTVVNKVPSKDRNIAMVFQNYALYPHMTVEENMGFGLKLRGVSKEERKAAVEKAAKILGIEQLLKRKPRALSGGQRQRVAMGRAIVRDPDVFLMDEPLSNLDAKLRTKMRVEIRKLQHGLKTTMIYVTHDQVEAMTLADKIAVLDGGYVQQFGTPNELYHKPANRFVAGFLGSPTINFIVCKRSGDHFTLPDGQTFSIPESRMSNTAQDIELAIRPKYIDIVENEASPDTPNIIRWKSKVNLVEALGGETLVYVHLGDQDIIVKLTDKDDIEEGSTVELAFNLDNAHIFDLSNGNIISHGVNPHDSNSSGS